MQLDDRVSWADVVAIITGLGVLATVVFGVQKDVELNAQEIKTNQERIENVQKEAHDDRTEILERLDQTQNIIEVIRIESRESRHRLDEKLDKLIEREIERN